DVFRVGLAGRCADLDEVGAPGTEISRVRQRGGRVQIPAAVGKGVFGDVENADDLCAATPLGRLVCVGPTFGAEEVYVRPFAATRSRTIGRETGRGRSRPCG